MMSSKYSITIAIVTCLATLTTFTTAQSYEDKRCKCICPSLNSVLSNNTLETDRYLIIENVPPSKCNCDGVILPRVGNKIKTKEQEFCPRCECKYENRNTGIIKFVVIIVIWVISLLVIYMLFLICLDPLLNKRIKNNYQEHTNEEDDTAALPNAEASSSNANASDLNSSSMHPMGVRVNVLNRVGHQQDKWKRQVREQRRNIYDRHTMLN